MANDTDSKGSVFNKDGKGAVIVVLPSLFALVIIILAMVICLLPRNLGDDEAKDKSRKKRMQSLDKNIRVEQFVEWAKKEQKAHPEVSFSNMLCVICLEDFVEASQIRGLGCHHVFHQECLDNWFARWNEYCPLCHRPIIPGEKLPQKRRHWDEPPPVAFMI